MGFSKFFKSKSASKKGKHYADIGTAGEEDIYEQLIQIFGVQNVFKNIYVMRASGRLTEIDLLAVHPVGVFVVESKNYSGTVIGDGNAPEWVQTKSNGFTRSFYSPVLQNAGHIDALREACQYHLGFVPPMLSLLVFPDKCELVVKGLPPGLRCCRLSQLRPFLGQVFNAVSPALGQQHVQALVPLFYQSQRSMLPPEIKEQHMRDVASAKYWAKNNR